MWVCLKTRVCCTYMVLCISVTSVDFEETFKLKAQGTSGTDKPSKPEPSVRRKPPKESLLDPNRSQNVAIARKKITCTSEELADIITKLVTSLIIVAIKIH